MSHEAQGDTAGPLMGWSLSSGMARRPLEELVDFPCRYAFKAVGRDEGDFVPSMLARVGAVLGRTVTPDEHSERSSSRGRYTSVTIDLWIESGAQLYEVYEAIYDDERVTHLL